MRYVDNSVIESIYQSTTRRARIWQIEREDGGVINPTLPTVSTEGDLSRVIRFTNWDESIEIYHADPSLNNTGGIYKFTPNGSTERIPDSISGETTVRVSFMAPSARRIQGALKEHTFEITSSVDNRIIRTIDVLAGRFDGAKVVEWTVDPANPIIPLGPKRVFWIDSVETEGEIFVINMVGMSSRFGSKIGDLTSKSCSSRFCLDQCKNVSDTVSGSVSAITSTGGMIFTVPTMNFPVGARVWVQCVSMAFASGPDFSGEWLTGRIITSTSIFVEVGQFPAATAGSSVFIIHAGLQISEQTIPNCQIVAVSNDLEMTVRLPRWAIVSHSTGTNHRVDVGFAHGLVGRSRLVIEGTNEASLDGLWDFGGFGSGTTGFRLATDSTVLTPSGGDVSAWVERDDLASGQVIFGLSSGDNLGIVSRIRTNSEAGALGAPSEYTTEITLQSAVPYPIEIGSVVNLVRGCARTFAACSVYDNRNNTRAQPEIGSTLNLLVSPQAN